MDFGEHFLRENLKVPDSCLSYSHQNRHKIQHQIRYEGHPKDSETNSEPHHIPTVLLLQLLSVLVDADSVLFELVDELLPNVNMNQQVHVIFGLAYLC